MAEKAILSDPEIMDWLIFTADTSRGPIRITRLMGASVQEDYGLPEWAVAIHVNGKPYTTLTLDPCPVRAE